MKRFLALLLIFSILCSVMLAGCEEQPAETKPVETKPTAESENNLLQEFSYYEDRYLVKEGLSDYIIVQESNEASVYTSASEELRKFLSEATGCALPIYVDGAELPAGKKIISLGETSYAQANSLTGKSLSAESFRIVDIDDNIYIVGQSGHGVLYGVYKLLNMLVNYEFFKQDCYSLDSNVTTLKLCDIDWTEEPDIAYTPGYHGLCHYNNGINALRYHNRAITEFSTGGTTGNFHNSLVILDATVYNDSSKPETYHPNWYSTTNDQLCYTARGDENELNAMIETVSDYFLVELRDNPTANYVLFQVMDNRSCCTCSACVAMAEKYGAKSTSVLLMSKKLHTAIKEKLEAEGDTRDIYVVPMLYNAIEDVPAVLDEATGKYKLTDESLDFSGVIPLWAAMAAKVHAKPWQDESNANAVEMLNKLQCAFESFWLWDYGVNFKDYFAPYNIFDNVGEDFKFLQQFNISLYLYQLDHTGDNSSCFGGLKVYLLSQLMWDADQDVEELTDKFFVNVYGGGAEAMRTIYDSWLNLWEYNTLQHGEVLPWDMSIYSTTMLQEEYYPRGTVREWLNLIDQAYAAIAPLKATNPNLYTTYEYNIKMESIFVRYLYAALYLTANNEENIAFKLALYNDVRDNFGGVNEGGTTWDFAVTLGIDNLLT